MKRLGPANAVLFAVGLITMTSILLTTAPVLRIVGNGVRPIRKVTNTWLSLLKLRQSWSVFATERNLARDGWFMIVGTLEDGTEADLLRDSSPPDWRKPSFAPGGQERLSIFWQTYLSNQERGDGENLDRLAAYLNWKHTQRSGGEGCRHIRMVFMEEPPGVQGDEVEAKEIVFWAGPPPDEGAAEPGPALGDGA